MNVMQFASPDCHSVFPHLPGNRRVRAAMVVLVLLSGLTAHAGEPQAPLIEVFVAGSGPRPGDIPGVTVYVIDAIGQAQAGLSADLPGDPEAAREIVLARLGRMEAGLARRLENAAQGLARAVHYGIDRYPAVVFDGQAVVYGIPDVDAARQRWRRWRKTRGGQ